MSTRLSWLDTDGGPFVILSADQAELWQGVLGDDESDFARACDIEDYIGLTRFDGGEALVLGDDPYPTTLLVAPAFGGLYIVRRLWGDDLEQAVEAVHQISVGDWAPEGVVFDAGAGDLVLFDCVHAGKVAPHRVEAHVAPGRYAVETADVQPTAELCVMVHRLVPMS